MNADPVEEVRTKLVLLRQNPTTKKKFPPEVWDAIIQLTKTYSHEEICHRLQLASGLLRRKIKQCMELVEFHEIPLKNISSETVTIELVSKNGIQAKIQGSLSCLNFLQQLLRG
jgi:hypothetical protein